MATYALHAQRVLAIAFLILLVKAWLPLYLSITLLAVYLARVSRNQSLEDDVARVSKLIRDRTHALQAMLATAVAVRTMPDDGTNGRIDTTAGTTAGSKTDEVEASLLPDCLHDLNQAQRLLGGRVLRQVARVVEYEDNQDQLSKERVAKLKAHAIEIQALEDQHHAQVQALNNELTTLRKDAARERAAWEEAVQAVAKKAGGKGEGELALAKLEEKAAAEMKNLQNLHVLQVQALKSEIMSLQAAAKQGGGTIGSAELANLKKVVTRHQAEAQALQAVSEEMNQALSEMALIKEQAAAKESHAREQIKALKEEITTLNKNAAGQRVAWEAAVVKRTQEQGMETAVVKMKREAAAEVEALKKAHKAEADFMENKFADLNRRCNETFARMDEEHEQALDDLNRQLDDAEQEIEYREKELKTLEEEAARQKAALDAAVKAAAEAEKRTVEAMAGKGDERKLLAQMQGKIDALMTEVEAEKEKHASLEKKLAEEKKELDSLHDAYAKITARLGDEQKKQEEVEKYYSGLDGERRAAVEEMNQLRAILRRVDEEAEVRGRAVADLEEEAALLRLEVKGLQKERDAALAEVPRVMEKLRVKAEKERALVATAGGMGSGGGEGGKEGRQGEGTGRVPTTEERVGTAVTAAVPPRTIAGAGKMALTTTTTPKIHLPSLTFAFGAAPRPPKETAATTAAVTTTTAATTTPSLLPPADSSSLFSAALGGGPQSFKQAAAMTAATTAAATTTPSLLPPAGSSSLFSSASMWGLSAPSSSFAPVAPPSPSPPLFTSSLFSSPSAFAWGKPSTAATTPAAATTTAPPPHTDLRPFSPGFRKEHEEEQAAALKKKQDEEEEKKKVAPPKTMKTTGTNTTTPGLPPAPLPPFGPKAPTSYSLTKPEKKEEEKGTKEEAAAAAKEKEEEAAAAAAAVAAAAKPPPPRRRRGFKISTF